MIPKLDQAVTTCNPSGEKSDLFLFEHSIGKVQILQRISSGKVGSSQKYVYIYVLRLAMCSNQLNIRHTTRSHRSASLTRLRI